ncbi:hypothetical protein EDD29_2289 [Actinocorallia herbida]|uniref:Secreted protein n=1 Tax=Actinocorallia herbida TaxID=58109 RepID=A0A3N1CTX5_9ACTN|nr:hypothetical protein [Actinocorallia herbida]ROO84761.1 hypothetical protein EDD29_2289 [Actinocorallia herbida]
MRSSMRRLAIGAATAALATAGLIGITGAPAAATSQDCTTYLSSQGATNTVRSLVCTTTAALAGTVGSEYAQTLCEGLMTATGLSPLTGTEACARAVQS